MTELSTILLCTSGGKYLLSPSDIIRLEASSNYTKIFFRNSKMVITAKVLKDLAAILQPYGFVRTHRAHLVNRQYIHCVTPDRNVIMKDSSVAEISRRKKSAVMKVLRNAA